MIYSASVTERDVDANPDLRSKVRKDDCGWVYKRSAIAYKGKCRVHVEASQYFGGEDSQSYLSRVIKNPTWGTLYKHAKKSMDVTKDTHHIFFEDFWLYTVEPDPKHGEVGILRLSLGS